jgi:hypothetical protein
MPRRLAFPVTPPFAFLRDHVESGERMAALGAALPPNLGSAYSLPDIRVYNPMAPDLYELALTPLLGTSAYGFPILERPRHSLYDFLGVRWLLTDPDEAMPRGMRLVFQHPDAWVWERPHPLPRLFLPATVEVPRGGEPWTSWLGRNPDLRRVARVERGLAADWEAGDPAASRLDELRVETTRVHARATLVERRLVVASLYQDGGWRLLAGGRSRETVLANGPFVAAWLRPGALDLDLLYRPRGFLPGCLLGALGLALGMLGWVPPPSQVRGREGDHGAHQDRGEEMEEEPGEVR